MDEDIEIINTQTRIEKIKNFLIRSKKKILISVILFILMIMSYFGFQEYNLSKTNKLAKKFNINKIKFETNADKAVVSEFIEIIKSKDKTYTPLAFYYLLDNNLINSRDNINKYFDILINEIDLDPEIKNLTIFKKGLYNSNFVDENELLTIMNPIINSKSIWRPHALLLMGEYYLSKSEMQKSKEFLQKVLSIEDISVKLRTDVQKTLRTRFSK